MSENETTTNYCVILIDKNGRLSLGAIADSGAIHNGCFHTMFPKESSADAVIDLYERKGDYRCVHKVELQVTGEDTPND